MTTPEQQADASPESNRGAKPLPNSVLKIPLTEQIFDTHHTANEHSIKEAGAWEEFVRRLEEPDLDLEEGYKFYLEQGPGFFYRAYEYGKPLTAGMTFSPSPGDENAYQLDSLLDNPDSESVSATAFLQVIPKFFEAFPLRNHQVTRVTASLDKINPAFLRAAYDYGFIYDTNLVIPMPGEYFTQCAEAEELEETRSWVKENSLTAVIPNSYIAATDDVEVYKEEFYREGVFVGAIVETLPLSTGAPSNNETLTAYNADGQEITLKNRGLKKANLRVHFVKTLAESDESLARLIAGRP